MMGMMKQVQAMQAKIADLQAEMDLLEVQGQSGAGLVTVTLNGKGVLKSVRIDPTLMNDEAEIVEDLIVTAHADAKSKSERLLEEKMKAITGGLPLPPGLKLF